MRRKYYINGWHETSEYFHRIFGIETKRDMEVFRCGNSIERNGNEFYIKEVEDPD